MPHSASKGAFPPPRTHSHACLGTQISASTWARMDRSSASLTPLREHHSSIRTSRSSRCVLTTYCIQFVFLEYLSFPCTRRQQCFGGNANSNSTTQSSASDTTLTSSASQTAATNATATTTDSASQTSATGTTSTDSASQTSATDTTATDSASQTSATDATSTDSASQTSATDTTTTPGARRHYDAPRAVRHSARFGRSYLALLAEP
jgi:hypothetical protein